MSAKNKADFRPESIRVLREILGLSQNQLARKLKCTTESIRNWEHGRSQPSGYFMAALYQYCQKKRLNVPEFFEPLELENENGAEKLNVQLPNAKMAELIKKIATEVTAVVTRILIEGGDDGI